MMSKYDTMGTKSRKHREFEHRERLFLREARRLLLENGFPALSMDQVAEALEYSRGTLYQHFRSKEDLVCALTLETMETIAGMMERVECFDACSRDKTLAWGFMLGLLADLHPDYITTQLILEVQDIDEKASPERAGRIRFLHASLRERVLSMMKLGIREGNLHLRDDAEKEELLFGLVALSWGALVTGTDPEDKRLLYMDVDLGQGLIRNIDALLDGYGWRPLSKDRNHEDVRGRILREVFAAEHAAVRALRSGCRGPEKRRNEDA